MTFYMAYEFDKWKLPLGTYDSIEEMEKALGKSEGRYGVRIFKNGGKYRPTAEQQKNIDRLPPEITEMIRLKEELRLSYPQLQKQSGIGKVTIHSWTHGWSVPNETSLEKVRKWIEGVKHE